MALHAKDNFSKQSELYALYRPSYPPEMYDFILSYVIDKDKALDCGTGNGQVASVLANYFHKVFAIDISHYQLNYATKKNNIEYIISSAEKTIFDDNSFNLITAATSVHWFRFDAFYQEVNRIAKDKCVIACWAYALLQTSVPLFNQLLHSFYTTTLKGYWDYERNHVDAAYKTIPFPFFEIQNSGFEIKLHWDLKSLAGYLNTWSAVQHYIRKNHTNPVNELIKNMRQQFADGLVFEVMFPIFMRIGIIEK